MIATTDYDSQHVFLIDTNAALRINHGTPVRCNHSIVIYVQQGTMSIEINYTTYNVTANTIIVLSPLDIITVKEVSDDYKDLKLVTPPSLLNERIVSLDIDFYEKLKAQPVTAFSGNEFEIISRVFGTLSLIRDTFEYECFEQSALNSIAILFQLYRHYFKNNSNNVRKLYESRKKTLFRKFVKEIIASYNKSREVLYYANELGVSAGYLNEVCNEVSNYSAKDIIDQAVSSRLKSELAYTDKSIQELADEYNFPSQSYFSRYYKRMTGLSPSEFRKSRMEDKQKAG